LGDSAGERCPPNATRIKYVLQTLDPRCLGNALGDTAVDALSQIGREGRCKNLKKTNSHTKKDGQIRSPWSQGRIMTT
jgi:hypothetical protein